MDTEQTLRMVGDGPHHSHNETRDALLLQIAALESKMAQTRALLLEQEEERLRLGSKINSLSSIDQLPPEVKTEIFYNALRLLNYRTGKGKFSSVTPFFLGKICQGWRDFVWSSPILWTNISLCLSKGRYEAQINLLRDWLSRTAKCPLSFQLTAGDLYWICSPPMEVLTMLVSVSARWEEVDFFLPDSQEFLSTISAAENSLPLLTTATVTLYLTPRQLNLFSTAPQLSALHLHNLHPSKVLAPWHQLREFTSEGSTVDEIRGCLHKMPNIIRCSLRDVISMIPDESWDLEIFVRLPALEHLEYLELWFDGQVSAASARILGPVKLPSLCEVSLHGPFTSSQSSAILPSIMTSFRSSYLLEKFTFGGTMTSEYDLIQVLENIPSIKDLYLNFCDQDPHNKLLTKELLQRLYPPHTDILLPNLRSLTYHGPTSLNEDIHLFRDMLVYRFRLCASQPAVFELGLEQRTVCQVRSVTVSSISKISISPDTQEELDSLVQEGLELSLTNFKSAP